MFSENLTIDGHIIGMLYRDLRTMKTYQRLEKNCCTNCNSNLSASTKQHRNMFMVQKNTTNNVLVCNFCSLNFNKLVKIFFTSTRIFSRLCYRLGEVFVLGACLLSVLRIPTVLTAPVDQSAMELNGKPRWINPCNIDPATLTMEEDNITQHSQLQTMLGQTKNALDHARQFRNDYVKHTFHVDFNDHHNTWKTTINYENWLPKIDKNLGEGTPEEHLANVEFDTSLKDIYKYLQVFAVALEQLIIDMKMENEPFSQSFERAFDFVNAVLCEYQFVMLERGVTPHPDVTRDIMTDDLRKITSSSERNLRDWVIFRDYMNTLEYAVDVLNHLTSKSLAAN